MTMGPFDKPFGAPNPSGMGAATPGASSPASVTNAITQKKPAGGDPFGALKGSAGAWEQFKSPRKPPISTGGAMTPEPPSAPGNLGPYPSAPFPPPSGGGGERPPMDLGPYPSAPSAMPGGQSPWGVDPGPMQTQPMPRGPSGMPGQPSQGPKGQQPMPWGQPPTSTGGRRHPAAPPPQQPGFNPGGVIQPGNPFYDRMPGGQPPHGGGGPDMPNQPGGGPPPGQPPQGQTLPWGAGPQTPIQGDPGGGNVQIDPNGNTTVYGPDGRPTGGGFAYHGPGGGGPQAPPERPPMTMGQGPGADPRLEAFSRQLNGFMGGPANFSAAPANTAAAQLESTAAPQSANMRGFGQGNPNGPVTRPVNPDNGANPPPAETGTNPPPAETGGNGRSGGRPVRPGERYSSDEWGEKLAGMGVKNTDEMIAKANEYSRQQGYDWVTPEVVAQYKASQEGDGDKRTFHEWALENYRDQVHKEGSPALTQGMDARAQRLKDEAAAQGADGSWVDNDHVTRYDQWVQENNGGIDPQTGQKLDFWGWADTVNRGRTVEDNWKRDGGGDAPGEPPAPPATQPDAPIYPDTPPPPVWGGGGNEGSTSIENTGSKVPDSEALAKLEAAMKERQQYVMGEADRAFNARMAKNGMFGTGAMSSAYGDMMANMSSDFNQQLAQPYWQSYENGQDRMWQYKGQQLGADASRYGADSSRQASMYGSQLGLEGRKFGDTMNYNLGLQGLGLDAWKANMGNDQFLMQLQAGMAPEAMFGDIFGGAGQFAPGYAWQPGRGG